MSERLLLQEYSCTPEQISEEALFEIHLKQAWVDVDSCKDFFHSLVGSERISKYNPHFWNYGSTETNDALLEIKDGKVLWIGVRLDARDKDRPYIERLVEFAQEGNLLFHELQTGSLIQPNVDSVRSTFLRSRATMFCTSPEAFFADKEYLEKINAKARESLENTNDGSAWQ